MAERLLAREQRFVEEYLVDLNAAAACRRAGYSARRANATGPRLLARERVQRALQREQEKISRRIDLRRDDVIADLLPIARSQITDYLSFGPDGVTLKSSDELTKEQTSAIAEVSEQHTRHGTSVRLKLHSKLDAIGQLCKMLGFNAPEEHNVTVDLAGLGRAIERAYDGSGDNSARPGEVSD